jgi:hypothetical protein
LGAGLLTFAVVGAALASPVYAISVTKTADPPNVPAGGADVTFSVMVTATTGDFHTVNVADSLGGCTLSAPTGDTGSDGVLSQGETWTYTCTVAGVTPQTSNTATVTGCHNSSPNCNQDAHDATGQGQVTVGLCESDCAAPPTPTPTPTGNGNGASDLPPTDTAFTTSGTSGPSDAIWLFVIGLGVLLGGLVVLKPSRAGRHR